MTKRKRYDVEYQTNAVRMILNEGLSIAEVSRRLGIDYSVLWRWTKKYNKLFNNHNHRKTSDNALDKEISALNAELERVIEERDTLMKALSHFIAQKK